MAVADHDRDIKMADSPGSSDLSELASDDEDDQTSIADISSRPSVDRDSSSHPAKRRKIGNTTSLNISYERASSSQPDADLDDIVSVSEDSFGSAPGSPTHDEYAIRDEAQTECLWQDCDFGRAQNNDELVQHVQSTHCATGGPKRAKYICEWGECQNKKNNVHPSNYALKAHCRSHTKEKPYYCALPECDKAFTRSDALAKHMRTVHEPELIKGVGGGPAPFLEPPAVAKKSTEPKITNGSIIKSAPVPYTPVYDDNGREIDPSVPNDNITYIPAYHPSTGQPGFMIHYPPDIHFSSWESSIRADELMRFLRRQIRWAEEENRILSEETLELEKIRRDEWTLKELLLDGIVQTEQDLADELPASRVSQARTREILDHAADELASAKRKRPMPAASSSRRARGKEVIKNEPIEHTTPLQQAPMLDETELDIEPETSPPPTGASGGFDGEDDPYDNYLQEMMKKYNKRDSDVMEDTQAAPAG